MPSPPPRTTGTPWELTRWTAALETLPTLPKAVLMAEFDRIVTDPRLRFAELERHLTGTAAPGLYLGAYHVFATSGSSGLHGITVFTEQEFRCWIAACVRMFARIGLGPDARVAAIGAPGPQHITRRLFAEFRSGRPGLPASPSARRSPRSSRPSSGIRLTRSSVTRRSRRCSRTSSSRAACESRRGPSSWAPSRSQTRCGGGSRRRGRPCDRGVCGHGGPDHRVRQP